MKNVKIINHLSLAVLAFLVLMAPCAAISLPTDRDQPFNIEADGAEFNESAGTSTYHGSVEITQGTMTITADEIKIKTQDSTVIQILARMKSDGLAHYSQVPEAEAEMITADAREINYLIQEEKLHLTGDARLIQNPNRFAGELLYYDIKKGVVNMKGGNEPGEPNGRIKLILTPKKEE